MIYILIDDSHSYSPEKHIIKNSTKPDTNISGGEKLIIPVRLEISKAMEVKKLRSRFLEWIIYP